MNKYSRLSSAAVVIGTSRVSIINYKTPALKLTWPKCNPEA